MSIFQFKQFTIAQDQCAMKINTDSVLLAAWASPIPEPQYILDIGTGTGVLALMMAQRFPNAQIIGIEIEENTAKQAAENAAQSPFSHRVKILHISLQDFAALSEYQNQFDCIICNPPYFNVKSHLLAHENNYARQIARATLTLTFDVLLTLSKSLLTKNSNAFFVLPATADQEFQNSIKMADFHIHTLCKVQPNPNKNANRFLYHLHTQTQTMQETALCIQQLTQTQNKHLSYTAEYATLLKDFLLIF